MKEVGKSLIETEVYRKRLDAVKELFQKEYGLRPGEPADITLSGLIAAVEVVHADRQCFPNVGELRRMLMPMIRSHRAMAADIRRMTKYNYLRKELIKKDKTM